MRVGIGLPVTTKDTSGELLLAWARRAEEAGFEALTAIDRVVYPGFESLTAMAAAAAATSRIGLRTNVLLAPARRAVMVAKQAASVDQISGGRFMLGIGVGRRTDDYEATGRDFHTRGRRPVMHYFALGEDSNVDYLFHYYGYQGDRARMFAEGAYRRAAEVTSAVQDFAAIGVDEYVFVPTMADLSQVDLLADAVSRARV